MPLTLAQANKLVADLHRHHKPVQGHRYSIGVKKGDVVVGAAIVGRPVAREIDQYNVAEVTRLVTDGTPHACSIQYAACARAAKAMGFERIQTYILREETGTSLVAAGWYRILANGERCKCEKGCRECVTAGGDWNHSRSRRGTRRVDQPMVPKQRWGKRL